MPRRTLAVLALAVIGMIACVDVPDSMRAQFAPAAPNERSNYRQGEHGTAPPIEDKAPASLPDAGAPSLAAPVLVPDAGIAEGGAA